MADLNRLGVFAADFKSQIVKLVIAGKLKSDVMGKCNLRKATV